MTVEIKADTVVETMTDDEIKAEYKVVRARLDEIEEIIDPKLIDEIENLRDYAVMLKGTLLARR